LVRLQEKSVDVLELLKANLSEKNGVQNAWKFEKTHDIGSNIGYDIIQDIWSDFGCDIISGILSDII
jgi:hypothetical protein